MRLRRTFWSTLRMRSETRAALSPTNIDIMTVGWRDKRLRPRLLNQQHRLLLRDYEVIATQGKQSSQNMKRPLEIFVEATEATGKYPMKHIQLWLHTFITRTAQGIQL